MFSYMTEVKIVKEFPNIVGIPQPTDIFTKKDMNYIEGDISRKPKDLELHLAIYLLEVEGLPEHLLEPIKIWASENKCAGTHNR